MVVEAWLERAAASAPQATALRTPTGSCSYGELRARARAGADELRARGVRSGDRVAIALPAGLDFAYALHACLLLGAAAVPVDLRLRATERSAIQASAALVLDEPLVGEVPGADCASEEIGAVHDLDAVAAVIHTSGTTSAPKPIELTYGNLLWSALGSAVALGLDPAERWLCALPLAHVGGLSILLRSAIYASTAVVHPRFETEPVLEALMAERDSADSVTLVSLVATTLARLLDAGLHNPPALRCALTGGGPVPAALLARARAAAVPVSLTYGLTEACSQVTTTPLAALTTAPTAVVGMAPTAAVATAPPAAVIATPPAAPSDRDGDGRRHGVAVASPDMPAVALSESSLTPSAGPALFCTQLRLGAEGEIEVAGPTVARAAAGPDGWLRTGDLGRLNAEGSLEVTGRKADTIVSGGENVAPAEVEAALEAHPEVLEAAVVGRVDARWGEAVAALVVAREGATLTAEQLREHCATRLAPYKVPKQVALIAGPLPRTRSGKLLRRELA